MTIEQDKLEHYVLCTAVTFITAVAVMLVGKSPMWGGIVATAFTLGLALGKEFGDSRAYGNHWCWWDLLADLLGILTGNGILFGVVKLLEWCAR